MQASLRRHCCGTCQARSRRRSGGRTLGRGITFDTEAARSIDSEREREERAMVVTTTREVVTPARTRRALIDCDFHDELDSIKDLYPYLSQRWREHIETYGTRGPSGAYYPRFMDHREDARPP